MGIGADPEQAKLDAVLDFERARINTRRSFFNLPRVMGRESLVGLALSGGGIRSATFSLGVLRELSERGLLTRVDYLSTVSGGSYIGAWFGGLYAKRSGQSGPLTDYAPKPGEVADPLGSPDAKQAIGWLRQYGRYLAPSGFGDVLYALTVMMRNWLGVQLVLGLALFQLLLLAIGLRAMVHGFDSFAVAKPGFLPRVMLTSPLLYGVVLTALLMTALGWAYWLTRREAMSRRALPIPGLVASVIVIAVSAELACNGTTLWQRGAGAAVAATGVVALVAWTYKVIARLRTADSLYDANGGARIDGKPADGVKTVSKVDIFKLARAWDLVRHDLTRWQAGLAQLALLLLGIALIDSAGLSAWRAVHAQMNGSTLLLSSPLVSAGLVPVAHWLLKRLGSLEADGWVSKVKALGLKTITALVAVVLAAALAIFWSGLAYALTNALVSGDLLQDHRGAGAFVALFGVTLAFNITIGYANSFLNLSSLSTFYAARLRRAYLGAGNKWRFDPTLKGGQADGKDGARPRAIDEGDANDEVALADYFGSDRAPEHLINITLNETVSTGSNLVQRDRHGRNLLLCTAGLIYSQGADDRLQRYNLIKPETLGSDGPALAALNAAFLNGQGGEPIPMSAWVGISGAAFSTGLGAQTSLGLTLLAGLANVRLGYWWSSEVPPWERMLGTVPAKVQVTEPVFETGITRWWNSGSWWPIQFYLYNELLGRFTGADKRRWYLTDGGHFDNTAVYELIRRKLPLIIACDNGEDGNSSFDDLANLVRKARIDFGAEVRFLDDGALATLFAQSAHLRSQFAPPADFAQTPPGAAVALLARITYADGNQGTLLLLKPRLTGSAPVDLANYHGANPIFPQQSTLDQFFDEAQWESYHLLGRLIAARVFGHVDATGWNPAEFEPLPPA